MPSRILVPLIIACALFMENLDSTVLSTALPAIAADLGEDPIRLKLALTSYLLSLAIFIPASGWLADRLGARHVFRLNWDELQPWLNGLDMTPVVISPTP